MTTRDAFWTCHVEAQRRPLISWRSLYHPSIISWRMICSPQDFAFMGIVHMSTTVTWQPHLRPSRGVRVFTTTSTTLRYVIWRFPIPVTVAFEKSLLSRILFLAMLSSLQVRIKIECAFGMLVNRWGMLRRALPATMGLRKTNALLMCLCRLHNFCIDKSGGADMIALAADTLAIRSNGGFFTVATESNPNSPEELLHGGEHNDDTEKAVRLAHARRGLGRKSKTPRDLLLRIIEDGGYERPTPKHW